MSNLAHLSDHVRIAFKAIKLRKQALDNSKAIENEFGIGAVAARVLAARGFKANSALNHFIEPTLKGGLPEPEGLKNLTAACELVRKVVAAGDGVAICCDFDVDGLSGGAQVYHFLRTIGVRCKVYVPDRFSDGYGLNERIVRLAASEGFKLLIAIDFGTTNERELILARSLGMRSIVIDHHHVGSHKSPADVFINPNQRGCGFADSSLCAAGLAWYMVVGLRRALAETKPLAAKIEARSYLDLACLGTICDMVPLVGANRVMAKRGLEFLTQTKRTGLIALKIAAGIKGDVNCSDVSFGIGPRINAAGRMVHGEMVIELLTTDDPILAKKIADQLNNLNEERRGAEQLVKERAVEIVQQRGHLPAGLVVWQEDFHTGVVGIVAQRLVEAFYRPTVILGMDTPGIYKGSVRGIRGFNVVEALAELGEHLLKYGGHAGAGGLSLEEANLESFEAAFATVCATRLQGIATEPTAEADTLAELADISPELIVELRRFAPFGMGNPAPQLLLKNLKVIEVKQLKGLHTKAILSDGRRHIAGLMWRQVNHPALVAGRQVNIVCKPDISTYRGQVELQANLQAIELV